MIESTKSSEIPTANFQPAEELDVLLERARRRTILLCGLAGAGFGLAFSALSLLVLALALGSHAPIVHDGIHDGAVRTAGMWVVAAGILGAPLAVLRALRKLTAKATATLLTHGDLRLRSLLLSAIELRHLPANDGVSTSLIRAQANDAARYVREHGVDPVKELSATGAHSALALGVTTTLCAVALLATGPEVLRRGFGLLRSPAASAAKGAAALEPITGDIELTFFYPPHTRLAPRTISGTSGEIEAPAGTEIHIGTRADRPVREAAIVVNDVALPLTVSAERQLSGTFTVTKAGSYHFRFGSAAHPSAEGPPIPISVKLDAPPQVLLTAPPETLEVEPQQLLTLRYQATDDYGISTIRLAYRLPGSTTDQIVPLKRFEDPPTHDEGSAKFDLAPLHLLSGDEVSYVLEAEDNDGVQGPKVGRSKPHHLKVYSEVEHHREALASARRLWERLLSVLGDRLDEGTSPTPTSGGAATDVRALGLTQEMEREAGALVRDKRQDKRLPVALMNTARRERRKASATADARERVPVGSQNFHPLQGAALGAFRSALSGETEGLEQDILYLEGLLDQASQDDLRVLSKELQARRRELSDLVDKYRKHPTPELRAEIQSLIARLKGRMGELMSRMQELAKSISDQHLNQEALAALHKNQDLGGDLAKAEDQIQRGDLDGALKSLDQMAQSLDSLQRHLDQTHGRQSEAYPGLTKKLMAFKSDLDEVQRHEQTILEKTRSIEQQSRKTAEERAPLSPQLLEQLKADTEKARAQLAAVPENPTPFGGEYLAKAKDRADQLLRALQSKDLGEARDSAAEALDAADHLLNEARRASLLPLLGLNPSAEDPFDSDPPPRPSEAEGNEHVKQAEPLLHSIRSRLDKLFPDERSLIGPKQQQELSQLQHDQERTRAEAQKLSQKLEQLGREAPIFDPSTGEALQKADEQMAAAKEQLSEREPGQAASEERGALEQLQQLQQSMQRGAGKENNGEMPSPFAFGMPPSDSQSQSDDGPDESEHEKVVVPGADQYQVPAEFRRDILDAMKQKAPASFEDQVKRYYQEIVK